MAADDEWACAGREDSEESYTVDYWFAKFFYLPSEDRLYRLCWDARYKGLPDNPGLSEED